MEELRACSCFVVSVLLVGQSMGSVKDPYQSKGSTIDTSACLPDPSCDPKYPYRNIEGICSNLYDYSWGMADTSFIRWLPANYFDGKSVPRKNVYGENLPPPRDISYRYFPDKHVPIKSTINFMLWGQLIAHDCSYLVDASDINPNLSCCSKDSLRSSDECLLIDVSSTDPFYSKYNVTCLFIPRGIPASGTCPGSPKEQVNGVTHVIDASFIYGNNKNAENSLRAFNGGKLKEYKTPDGRKWPPMSSFPKKICNNPSKENFCLSTQGDPRVNQNSGLTLYTILFFRLHNYLAIQLYQLNSHWNEETLYQEARRIVWAVFQHITYKQYLPILLGAEYARQKGLLGNECKDCCVDYHIPQVNPSTYAEWSGAGFRVYHSLIPREIIFYNEQYEPFDNKYLDDWYFRPYLLKMPGNMDALTRGMVAQPQENQDPYFSVALTQFLFKSDTSGYGKDLVSFDIQRGRDQGLPTYNDFRELCGFPRATKFQDFGDFMSYESISKLKEMYKSVNDVDLYTGAVLENLIPGTYVGPTLQCLNGEQFYTWMVGDRWFYENCGTPISLSQEQITAIGATTPAWIMCTVGDNIQSIQRDTFYVPSKANPVVSCNHIPKLDLSPWRQDKQPK